MEAVVCSRPFQWQCSFLQTLADGGYALSRFAKPGVGGYVWQQWAYRLMVSLGAHRIQGPGTRHLFDYPSLSGLTHELDAAGIKDVAVVLEAKDQGHPVDKTQVDAFDGKTFDCFEGAIHCGYTLPLYRMMWSTMGIDPRLRRYAARKGIIMVGPDRVPLPSLIAAAERWDAVEWFPDSLLADLVYFAERACRPLAACSSSHGVDSQYPLYLWKAKDLDDLDYLHDVASEHYLNWLDWTSPLYYEVHAARCLRLAAGWFELRKA
jgi:hypothetical protein